MRPWTRASSPAAARGTRSEYSLDGAVGDDGVRAGVERVDQRGVLLGHRVRDEIVQAGEVFSTITAGVDALNGTCACCDQRHRASIARS